MEAESDFEPMMTHRKRHRIEDPAFIGSVMGVVVAVLAVVSGMFAYIQYTHAETFTDDEDPTKSYYAMVTAVAMGFAGLSVIIGLVFLTMIAYQGGVWATRDGVPRNESVAELAFMPPGGVIALYVILTCVTIVNAIFSILAEFVFVETYADERLPYGPQDMVWSWGDYALAISIIMIIVLAAAVALLVAQCVMVKKAMRRARINIDGVALSSIADRLRSKLLRR
jgi:hypothetical protein